LQVTALLTGRGNNSFKDKNILPLNGHPVLYYPAISAKESKFITQFFVSSECEKILREASKCNYEKILRPINLSSPTAIHHDVIIHSIQIMNELGHKPDILVVLLANSPTIKTSWIDDCIQLLIDKPSASSVVPVINDQDRHPFRAKTISEEGNLKSFFNLSSPDISSNRQQLPDCFYLCHNFWVIRLNENMIPIDGEPPWNFLGSNVLPYQVEEAFDIHTPEDLERASRWLDMNKDAKHK
jgi:CMP-N,N'-diacetyllegionaminic acid synthase